MHQGIFLLRRRRRKRTCRWLLSLLLSLSIQESTVRSAQYVYMWYNIIWNVSLYNLLLIHTSLYSWHCLKRASTFSAPYSILLNTSTAYLTNQFFYLIMNIRRPAQFHLNQSLFPEKITLIFLANQRFLKNVCIKLLIGFASLMKIPTIPHPWNQHMVLKFCNRVSTSVMRRQRGKLAQTAR